MRLAADQPANFTRVYFVKARWSDRFNRTAPPCHTLIVAAYLSNQSYRGVLAPQTSRQDVSSLRAFRSTLPVALRGSSLRKWTCDGHLK